MVRERDNDSSEERFNAKLRLIEEENRLNKLIGLNLLLYRAIVRYAHDNGIPLPFDCTITRLVDEIESMNRKNQASRLSNESLQRKKPDKDFTVPPRTLRWLSDESKQPHKPDNKVTGVTKLQVTNFHMENKIGKVTKTSQNLLESITQV
jgi:hypothetical protein